MQSQECENLTKVVRELTQGRSKLVAGRAIQAERLAELQHEYERVLRIADLSRSLSKENMAKAGHAQGQLRDVCPSPFACHDALGLSWLCICRLVVLRICG